MPKGEMTTAEFLAWQRTQNRQRPPTPPPAPSVLPTAWSYRVVGRGRLHDDSLLRLEILTQVERIRAIADRASVQRLNVTLLLSTPVGDFLVLTDAVPGQLTPALQRIGALDTKEEKP